MKKILLILTAMLVLSSCAAKEETLRVTAASSPAESVPVIHENGVEFISPNGQQRAMDAYQEIIDFFAVPNQQGDPGYPDDFGDAYIGEDYYLYVCLTDTQGPGKMKYMRAVKEPQILRFVEVEHSWNDLYALQMALAELDGLEFSFISVDVTGNEVDLGIPDIGKEAEVRQMLEDNLPEDIRNRFTELPVSIEEAGYATFG